MPTRSQAAGERPAPQQAPGQPPRRDARKLRTMVQESILNMEPGIAALEGKDVMTDSNKQAALRISKMLESMLEEYRMYHYEIVSSVESEDDGKLEQEEFNDHQKTMDYIDRLGDLLAKPTASNTTPPPTNDRLVGRQLQSTEESVGEVRRAVDAYDVERHALTTYLDKTKCLEGELQVLKKEILSLDEYGDRKTRASCIERDLLQLRVDISGKLEPKRKSQSQHRLGRL